MPVFGPGILRPYLYQNVRRKKKYVKVKKNGGTMHLQTGSTTKKKRKSFFFTGSEGGVEPKAALKVGRKKIRVYWPGTLSKNSR